MARRGRSARRTGDIYNIVEDLVKGDEIAVKTGRKWYEGKVVATYHTQVSSWGMARMVAVHRFDADGAYLYLLAMTLDPPYGRSPRLRFVAVPYSSGSDEISEIEVLG